MFKILNLGAGDHRIDGAIGVDTYYGKGVDVISDLSLLPWAWGNDTIDGIYMIHALEHFTEIPAVLFECWRILKPGGFLHLVVPHSSCCVNTGCLGHTRTFSYNTLHDYLTAPDNRDGHNAGYMFGGPMFRTTKQLLSWWYGQSADYNVPPWMRPLIKYADLALTKLANMAPRVCENGWVYLVGGMREVVWCGVKI
jgi:predicted SAM-dependent methyltransferase